MKVSEVLKLIEADGWYLVRTRGSHRVFSHPTKAGIVVIAGKPSKDVPIGTLAAIQRQAQIDF
ncbi:MAG TPA: type II toxin-antitoxin system HicA family toxin [Candidatus Obscuribacterales bacterium]